MTVENILLDCDPGLDDAAAIFLAAGSPRIHVLGITTVAGNQTIERVTKNAFFVAKMAGMGDVPMPGARHGRFCVRRCRSAQRFTAKLDWGFR